MLYPLFGTINKVPAAQSPLTFVVTVMLTLFLVVIAVLGTTASGRQTSSRYMAFAGLYDLALAANQHTLHLFDQEAQIIERLQQKEPELIYKDGRYFVDVNLIRAAKQDQLAEFLSQNFGKIAGDYYFSYRLAVYSGIYYVRTYISQSADAIELRSVAVKEVNGIAGTSVRVYARIEWPNLADAEIDPEDFNFTFTNELKPQMLRMRRVAN